MPPEYYAVSIEFGDPSSTTFVVLPPLHFSARSIQAKESVEQASTHRVTQVVILIIFVVILSHLTIEHLLIMAVALKTDPKFIRRTSIASLLETMAPIRVVRTDIEGNVSHKAETETFAISECVMDRPIGTASNSLNDPSSNATTHQRQNDLTRFTNMPENMVAKVIAPLALEEPQVKTEPESISSALRHRRQVLRRSPYPIRSKGHLPTSDSSESPSSPATIDKSLSEFDHTHSSSCAFGYNLCDYRQRKVINKNATTSWYTYRTPGPLDSPPEFPPNSMGPEHNVIFLHINEAERAKLNGGQLSKLLKYCVRMWIWNGDSLRWERIYFGEQRVVGDGYELAIALRYRKGISPKWVTPKAMKRILKASR
ncbi:hypothetical protein F5876DRAFT_81967 [Lentinula aff. lateritia]|uniref:Uncharacterized protein n=1 Tax=Lentinula aff. lateritia TaxID=2804960 RepID=A0ACC1TKY3_9AGAR|nr:hypothetical protein F5876DRAFT_81967 [Lentinula aff. lateritia]